ncbi:FAD binding domain-containing protein [Amorphus orientalis]|uniref:Carbon-monoxide dehydrogenase medium subunit n=1 Tax=Amorphus orientalis TaxID=649198 RepID=A0AAE3VPL7_9HYPH|nr:FAD binding domain-containing protein [Amorphus orientalis]MDQ0315426.1 carbon-monoxide dehydrogenase medium subunit [Amorphus orientalis]
MSAPAPDGAPRLLLPTSLPEAVALLAETPEARPMAGATWLMRAPLRGETHPRTYVALGRIADLKTIEIGDAEIRIGAGATHAELAAALAPLPECRGLADAAGRSANRAVRAVATVGGNIASAGFAAADLVPALLAADAEIELEGPDGARRIGFEAFLTDRAALAPSTLIARVVVPRGTWRSAHARLPLRVAGDYPVAIVDLLAATDAGGLISRAAVAVGSVEPVARRWTSLEAALVGTPLDADAAAEMAKAAAGDFEGRDGADAPGRYRVQVLPALVQRAVAALAAQS